MKTKALCLIGLLTALFCARPARAAVVMTIEQVGLNVVATGSGTVNTAGLSFTGTGSNLTQVSPSVALLEEGITNSFADFYSGTSGPANFGPGLGAFTLTGTGDSLAIFGAPTANAIVVPVHYQSGTPLSSTATFANTTLATLGVTPGVYTWTWGSGANADSLTLYAGVPVPVPEPAPAFLLTLGAAAFAVWRRIKK